MTSVPVVVVRPHPSGSWEVVGDGEPGGILLGDHAAAITMALDWASAAQGATVLWTGQERIVRLAVC